MKDAEDEAFEDVERRQGGFQTKRAAAADKLQEPVAWITPDGEGFRIRFSAPTNDVPLGWDALYATPPKRPWVGLEKSDMPDEENPMFDHEYFIAGMVFASNVLKKKNT
jgi:hypothetical protein